MLRPKKNIIITSLSFWTTTEVNLIRSHIFKTLMGTLAVVEFKPALQH